MVSPKKLGFILRIDKPSILTKHLSETSSQNVRSPVVRTWSIPVRERSLDPELVGPVRFILSTEFITSARKVTFCVKMFTFKVPFIRFDRY